MNTDVKELPDVADILSTVRDFLQRCLPTLAESARFEAQIAIFLLDVARRQVEASSDAEGRAGPSETAALRRRCREIRSGARDSRWEETLGEELDAAGARVRIARPDHLAATPDERPRS
jgi:hypothetical protein